MFLSLASATAQQVRVACVGNSITYGHGIENRDVDTYPAQLQALLGDAYDVKNFGVSGTTAQEHGDFPWISTPQYRQALAFAPQIVILKLGTNDSKPQNWKSADLFINDVEALIQEFEQLPSHPKIYLALPAKAFNHAWNIDDKIISKQEIPALKKLAKQHQWTLIDLHKPTSKLSTLFPDGIHPNVEGAGVIARIIKGFIVND